jgi:hypothetical protein
VPQKETTIFRQQKGIFKEFTKRRQNKKGAGYLTANSCLKQANSKKGVLRVTSPLRVWYKSTPVHLFFSKKASCKPHNLPKLMNRFAEALDPKERKMKTQRASWRIQPEPTQPEFLSNIPYYLTKKGKAVFGFVFLFAPP